MSPVIVVDDVPTIMGTRNGDRIRYCSITVVSVV